jgi:hypothetical protein
MKKRSINLIKTWGVPLGILLIILVSFKPFVYFFPKWFTSTYYDIFAHNSLESKMPIPAVVDSTSLTFNPNVTGPIGDTFGGMLGPIIAILAAFLTFLAFWIQYKANIQQENYIKQQRFEDTFFRLLDHLKKIVDSIDIRNGNDLDKVIASGSESFKSMYDYFKNLVRNETDISFINQKYDITQNFYKHDLHHYFRFLYHILKFIKQSEISEDQKFKYSSILRATLSAYELVFIFYNGLHANGNTHLKPLLEEFSFLKNMDSSILINLEQKKEYDVLAFASSSDRVLLIKERKKKKK